MSTDLVYRSQDDTNVSITNEAQNNSSCKIEDRPSNWTKSARTAQHIIYQKKIAKGLKNTINASFFKRMIKEGWFFLVSSFFGGFFAIIICLIGAAIPRNGGEVLSGIGLITSFQIIFKQIGFAMALAMVLALVKLYQKRSKDVGFINEVGLITSQIVLNIFVGVFMTGLDIMLSYGYAYYNTIRPNMVLVRIETLNYIWVTAPVIILNSWTSVGLLVVFKNKGNLVASLLVLANNIIGTAWVAFFAFGPVLNNSIGIATGYVLKNLFALIITFTVIITGRNRYHLREFRFKWDDMVFLLKTTYKTGIIIAWRVSVRGIVVLVISMLTNRLTHTTPLSIVLGKALWFNINYFLPWFSSGVAEAFKYVTVKRPHEYSFLDIRALVSFVFICLIINILTGIIYFAALPNTIDLYIRNYDSLRIFALKNLYTPHVFESNAKFKYLWDEWSFSQPGLSGDYPPIIDYPHWVREPQYWDKIPLPIRDLNGNNLLAPFTLLQKETFRELYWVNVTTYGYYTDCKASVFPLFWGWQCWHATPEKYPPFFSTAILFILLYHMVSLLDSYFTMITSLYTKKSRSFLTSLVLHAIIMTTVTLFGYFETPMMGVTAYVLPYFIFSSLLSLRTIYIFAKVANYNRIKYYSENPDVPQAKWFIRWEKFKKSSFAIFFNIMFKPLKRLRTFSARAWKWIIKKITSLKWVQKAFKLKEYKKVHDKKKIDISLNAHKVIKKNYRNQVVLSNDINIKDKTMSEADRHVFSDFFNTRMRFQEYLNGIPLYDNHSHRNKRIKIKSTGSKSMDLSNDCDFSCPNIHILDDVNMTEISNYDDTLVK